MALEPIIRRVFDDPDLTNVEARAVASVETDPERHIALFLEDPRSFGGRYVAADLFKETFSDYSASIESRGRYTSAVHNASSVLAAEQYRRCIEDNSDPERRRAVFLTGCPGAGKTSSVLGAEGMEAEIRVLFEVFLANPEIAVEKIQMALDAGLDTEIIVVHPTPENALDNAIRRLYRDGRSVSIDIIASVQAGLASSLETVHAQFGDRLSLLIVDRRHPLQDSVEHEGWSNLPILSSEGTYEQIRSRLSERLEQLRSEGRIDDRGYHLTAGNEPVPDGEKDGRSIEPNGAGPRIPSQDREADLLAQAGNQTIDSRSIEGGVDADSGISPSPSSSGKSRTPLYETVAERLIEQLENGTAPWQRPWAPGELRGPYNPTTDRPYRGGNGVWLRMQGHEDPRWMTYRQAEGLGAQVRKGEKGTPIVYWKTQDTRPLKDAQGNPVLDENGQPRKVTVLLDRPRPFGATVFNATQIDGLPALEPATVLTKPERHEKAEKLLADSGAAIRHVRGNNAYYAPIRDEIVLPERDQFLTPDNFYATALHEVGHWTGHPSRLDRDMSGAFGSELYAREELRAEIASLMIGEELGIGHDPGQHAAYVGSWIKALKEDPQEIFRASRDAEKILGYLNVLEIEHEQEQEVVMSAQPPLESESNPAPTAEPPLDRNGIEGGFPKDRDEPSIPTLIDADRESLAAQTAGEASDPGEDAGDKEETAKAADEAAENAAGTDHASEAEDLAVIRYTTPSPGAAPQEGEPLVHLWADGDLKGTPAVLDYGRLLTPADHEAEVQDKTIQAMLDIAVDKGWDSITITGSRAFRARMAEAAEKRGITILAPLGKSAEATSPMEGPESSEDATASSARIPLEVPFSDKDQVKALGAKWDRAGKFWYIPDGVEPEPFDAWIRAESTEVNAYSQKVDETSEPEVRTYLDVPFAEKDQASALGARWDADRVKWYLLGDIDPEPFRQWLPQSLEDPAPITTGESMEDKRPEALPPETESRTYLLVPFRDKDQARSKGARWDKEAKAWYATGEVNLKATGLDQWLPENQAMAPPPPPPIEQFRAALQSVGLIIPGEIMADGLLHRVPVEGDRGSQRSGAYVLHLEDRVPGGYIQNFKTGELLHFKAETKGSAPMSPEQIEKARKEAEATKKAREIAKAEAQAATALAAKALWAEANPSDGSEEYLTRKGIDAPKGVRTAPAKLSDAAEAHGLRISKSPTDLKAILEEQPDARIVIPGSLLVPAMNIEGEIRSLQSIHKDQKIFMRGGQKTGLFAIAGSDEGVAALNPPADGRPLPPIIIAEGYATAATVSRLLDQPVVVAFDSGNLEPVALAMREKYPERTILFAADNDLKEPKKNPGLDLAKQAAKGVAGGVMVPPFQDASEGSDWNDYATRHGQEAARKTLREELAGARYEVAVALERMTAAAHEQAATAESLSGEKASEVRDQAASALVGVAERGEEIRSAVADAMSHPDPSSLANVREETANLKDEAKAEKKKAIEAQWEAMDAKDQKAVRERAIGGSHKAWSQLPDKERSKVRAAQKQRAAQDQGMEM